MESASPSAPSEAGKWPRLPKLLYVVSAIVLATGLCFIGKSFISHPFGDGSAPLTWYWDLILGILLLSWSTWFFAGGIALRLLEVRDMLTGVRTSMVALSQRAAADQRTGLAVSNSVTLLKEVTEAPDRVVFTPVGSPLGLAVVLIVGLLFAGVGGLLLGNDLARASESRRAETIELPKGGYPPYPGVGLSEWAIPAVSLGIGLILIGGVLWAAWTTRSLIVKPEKRELVRRIAFRWPAWAWTRSWPATDIESVYLDEYVTVWPGTPKFWTLWKVEPRESSEGHVWIRLRTGKAVDCGKGTWEEASALSARLGGLLRAPKILRERFVVGPPPSNDTSF